MSAAIRVLHVFGGMNRGGAETLAMNLYREMDRSRIQFDFAVSADGERHYDSEIQALGGRILRLPVPAQSGFGAWEAAFGDTLRRAGPFAAVHSHVHLFSGVVLRAARRCGVPRRISHSHSNATVPRWALARHAYLLYMRHLMRRFGTHLLGCSRQACESLFGAGCWSDRRVQTIPNAIRLADYSGALESREATRNELGLTSGEALIGHVGSFSEPKNHPFLIQVFKGIHRRLPDAKFVLVGDGLLRPSVEECVREAGLEGQVHLLGVRTDIPRIMGALDLLLLPSLWEGFPVVLVEAQAAGVPCLVSDSVTKEVDLNTGLVRFAGLKSGAENWADASLAHLDCARPAGDARERALREAGFDIGSVSRRLAGIYSS